MLVWGGRWYGGTPHDKPGFRVKVNRLSHGSMKTCLIRGLGHLFIWLPEFLVPLSLVVHHWDSKRLTSCGVFMEQVFKIMGTALTAVHSSQGLHKAGHHLWVLLAVVVGKSRVSPSSVSCQMLGTSPESLASLGAPWG